MYIWWWNVFPLRHQLTTSSLYSASPFIRSRMSDDTPDDQPVYNTEYQSEDADIRIISSDDVEFKVHSYQLQAAR